MPEPERRIVEFERLNWLGRAVYIGGHVIRAVGTVVDVTVERVADIIGEAESVFRQALDEDIEDAKILEEEPKKPEK